MKKILSLILAAAVVLAVTAGISAKSLQSSPSRTIGVDGSISADEWGAPAFSGDKETCWAKNATYGWDFWQNTTAVAGQYFNIYFTKDENYAYIGVELIGAAGPDSGAATVGDLWAHAHMAFTLSAYDAATTVPRITFQGQTYEQYGYWMIGLLGGTTKAMESKSQGMDTYNLQSSEYAVAYHAATSTYVYEVAVPWSATNIDPDEHSAVVLSVDLADAYTTTSGNRYLICPGRAAGGKLPRPEQLQARRLRPACHQPGGYQSGKYGVSRTRRNHAGRYGYRYGVGRAHDCDLARALPADLGQLLGVRSSGRARRTERKAVRDQRCGLHLSCICARQVHA